MRSMTAQPAPKKRTVLFLSPHLDDAVFSCPGQILAEVHSGAAVVVATLFSHSGPKSPKKEYRARREEDRKAVTLLGATPHWFRLPDAPYRFHYYRSFRAIIFGEAPSDELWVPEITKQLHLLVDTLDPIRIYAPLGVGNHIDHRLTFRAVLSSGLTRGLRFYEERPYSLVPHAVEWRRHQILRNESDDELSRAYWSSLLRARYVKNYLPGGSERRLCREALMTAPGESRRTPRSLESEIHTVDVRDIPLLADAVFAYQSQTPAFLGSQKQWLQASRRYARTLDCPRGWCERLWVPSWR